MCRGLAEGPRRHARGDGSGYGETRPGGARRGAETGMNPCVVAFSESPSVPLGLNLYGRIFRVAECATWLEFVRSHFPSRQVFHLA